MSIYAFFPSLYLHFLEKFLLMDQYTHANAELWWVCINSNFILVRYTYYIIGPLCSNSIQ